MSDLEEKSDPDAGGQASLLSMQDICKSFSGVQVLTQASFDLRAAETHVLAGENGAGKSTLIKILAGVYSDYNGRIQINGKPVRYLSPHEAFSGGIAVIHQEMSLINSMSVIDNIFLGRECTFRSGCINKARQAAATQVLMEELGLELDIYAPVSSYPLPIRQMIEIGKALAREARIVVMDEPTSALNEPEVKRLYELIKQMKSRGCGIIYISHRMEEIYALADRITVLRDGESVGTKNKEALPPDELIRMMVGRSLKQQFPAQVFNPGEERLCLEHVFVPDRSGSGAWAAEDISMTVKAGEIVGLAGLQGSGNSELLHGIFGAYGALFQGRISISGRPCEIKSPHHSIRNGLALLTNDRQGTGLVPGMSITHNITMSSLEKHTTWGWLRPASEETTAQRLVDQLRVKATSIRQPVQTLSGGNQQKVVLAKWLARQPAVLLLDDPTRGVDVGAKHDIYELMNQWSAEGFAIVFISSELPELLAMSDRILVMHRGRIIVEYSHDAATAEKILHAAMGGELNT